MNASMSHTGLLKFDSISAALTKYKWLPIKSCILFYMAILIFKVSKCSAFLKNLSLLISPYVPLCLLQSSDQNCLAIHSITSAAIEHSFHLECSSTIAKGQPAVAREHLVRPPGISTVLKATLTLCHLFTLCDVLLYSMCFIPMIQVHWGYC